MTDKEKLSTEKQIAIYDMLDAKCTVTDEGVQGFMTWEQIRGVYNSIIEETKEIDFEKELRKYFGQVHDFTLCMNIAKTFYDKGYFDGHIHDVDEIVHVDGRRVNVSRFKRVAKPLEEPVSEELEKELSVYVNSKEYTNSIGKSGLLLIARHFANWQKEQMLKNAVNAYIDHPFKKYEFPNIYPDFKELMEFANRHKLKDGDKVKVIIIKDE